MKNKKKTHDDVVKHFQKRCLERVGRIFSQHELKKMMANNELSFFLKQSNTRSMWKLSKDNDESLPEDLLLVYDKPRKAFVTVLFYAERLRDDYLKNGGEE